MKILLLLLAAVASSSANSFHRKETCDMMNCRAGRECVLDDGVAQCLCIISCPDHHKPVCGNDVKSYANHCLLHQHACITSTHISIKHKGYCKNKLKSEKNKQKLRDRKDAMLSKNDLGSKLEHDLVDSIKRSPTTELKTFDGRRGPAACFTSQRDAMRYLMVGYWNENAKSQSWYKPHMNHREQLWGFFYTCDTDRDISMTPLELLECAKDVDFYPRPGQNKMETKALCIEAIINDADKNMNAVLDFNEFSNVMNQKYQPKDKQCSLEGKSYTDGEEVIKMCNKCICAIGSWICTPSDCEENKKDRNVNHVFQPDDFDNVIDESTFTDDFRSFDIKHTKSVKDDIGFDTGLNTNFDEDLENGLDFTVKDTDDVKIPVEDDKTDDYDDYYDEVMEKKSKVSKKEQYNIEKALKKLKLLEKETAMTKKMIKNLKKEKQDKKKSEKSYDRVNKKVEEMKKIDKMMKKEKKSKNVAEEKPWMELLDVKNYDVSKFRENGLRPVKKDLFENYL